MKSNLAYVHTVAEAAVEAQLKDPRPYAVIDGVPRTRISGIDVLTNDPVAERRGRLSAYKDDAQTLRQKLADADVAFLAILPTTAWNRIADEANLYRFTPDENGVVRGSKDPLTHAIKRAQASVEWQPLAMLLSGSALCALGAVLSSTFLHHDGLLYTSLYALLGVVLGGWIGGSVGNALYRENDEPHPVRITEAEHDYIQNAFKGKSKDEQLKLLFPNREETPNGIPIAIGLPPAPSDAQENLRRAERAGLKLTLDTVADAIMFEEEPASAYVNYRAPHWKKEREAYQSRESARRADRERARQAFFANLQPDPIVTTSYGSATAVIVQYGEFPVEQKLVHEVLNSSYLV